MRFLHSSASLKPALLLTLALSAAIAPRASAESIPDTAPVRPAFVWIEGEKPTGGNMEVAPASNGHPEWLSDGKWLFVGIEAKDVEQKLPKGGATIEYAFDASKDADTRSGTASAWSSSARRSTGGSTAATGQTIVADKLPTIDLMELASWNEVGWLKMGDQRARRKGEHTLEIRLPLPQDAKGKPERVLYACDALCLSSGPFHPYSKFKPGETDRDEADEKAAKQVFDLPAAGRRGRAAAPCRSRGCGRSAGDDEALPGEVAEPIKDFPASRAGRRSTSPATRTRCGPTSLFAHRLWYRTRVERADAALAGRSFFLTFPQNNLNTTVYVNGVLCGFDKNPFVHFDFDVTKGIKPGRERGLGRHPRRLVRPTRPTRTTR